MLGSIKRMAVILGVITVTINCVAQMLPDAPVENFRLPRFDEETGYIKWVLRGTEGRYVSEEEFHITEMLLRVYTGTEDLIVTFEIYSPEAVMLPDESSAYGLGSLKVEGEHYSLEGSNWSWQGNDRLIEVRERATVTFREDMGYILE